MKNRFLKLLRPVDRGGIDNLITYIANETDFFTAPASTQYHGAEEGGLLTHSLAVYDNLLKIENLFIAGDKREAMILISLLHDLCKANFYKVEYRNRKNEYGQWEKYPCYAIEDQYPIGHGEKSVILIMKFIQLTDEEIAAINWHMAGFDSRAKELCWWTSFERSNGQISAYRSTSHGRLSGLLF